MYFPLSEGAVTVMGMSYGDAEGTLTMADPIDVPRAVRLEDQ